MSSLGRNELKQDDVLLFFTFNLGLIKTSLETEALS